MIRPMFCLATAAVLLHSLAGRGAETPLQRPNVIIVLTDDQGYGDLSCHGNPVLKTPHLDTLHSQSTRLTDFHVAPLCTPTRGQLMSGLDGLRNGAMNVSSGRAFLRRGVPTMADIFAANGYGCGQFGKWHLGDNHPYRPRDRGFHESLFFPSSHIGSAPDFWNNAYFNDTYQHNGQRARYEGYTTDVFFNQAIEWIRGEAAQKRPFLCYLATAAAHAPYFVPPKCREAYGTQKPHVARFFGMIANIDENMGRLEEFLTKSGLRDNTIVIFMTDNGGTGGVGVFNARMRGAKMSLYDGGHRVPCFIRWPNGKLRPAGDVAELTTVQDIMPTLIDLCGLHPREKFKGDGVSLARLLRGEADALPDRMVVVQVSPIDAPIPQKGDACVLWEKYRLVSDKELYDLASDPGQKQNITEQFPTVVAKMRAHYEQWWATVEPRVNEHSTIALGSDAENSTQLSPADWEDVFLDQGEQIRAGLRRNGPWNVVIEKEGTYEIEMRRWAREADAPLTAGLPPHKHADGEFPAGVALPIAKARLSVADIDQSATVTTTDKSITFTVELKPGATQLKTWFYDPQGKEISGAYYVYVTRK